MIVRLCLILGIFFASISDCLYKRASALSKKSRSPPVSRHSNAKVKFIKMRTSRYTPDDADILMGTLITSEYVLDHYMNPLQKILETKSSSWQSLLEALNSNPNKRQIMQALKISNLTFVEYSIELIQERNIIAHPREHDLKILTEDRLMRISRLLASPKQRKLVNRFSQFFNHLKSIPRISKTRNRPKRLLNRQDTDDALFLIKLFHILDRNGRPHSLKFSKYCRQSLEVQKILSKIPTKMVKQICNAITDMRNEAAHPKVDLKTFKAYSKYVLGGTKYYDPLLSKVKKRTSFTRTNE